MGWTLVSAIFKDPSKAFDRLLHDILIAKIHAYSFHKKLLESYCKTEINVNIVPKMEGAIMYLTLNIVNTLFISMYHFLHFFFQDQRFNPSEFPEGRYLRGTLEGIWWAFVSMTTVG